ncbi:MAG: DUF432 domain-containing protein, partial [Nitrosopumilus sp.]|nr:DUF432 domain-containing protein [Nitrosopumilus sp.]
FSKYGIYTVTDFIELTLPNTKIRIERIGDKAFSYTRKNSEDVISEKIIPSKSNEIEVELAPISPLNHPARRTDYLFLKFDKDIFLSEESAASVFVHCPIEIGLFLIHNSQRDSLDWITCDPAHSRFGLYGSPDNGTLCKYANVSMAKDMDDSISYINGVMKVVLENKLNTGQSVSKVIFPITDNSIYYSDSKAIIDGIKVTLKKRAVVSIADVKVDPISTNWKKSPTWEITSAASSMEMGLE